MWLDQVSNPGPLTYESGALPTALRGLAVENEKRLCAYILYGPAVENEKGLCASILYIAPFHSQPSICTVELQWLKH